MTPPWGTGQVTRWRCSSTQSIAFQQTAAAKRERDTAILNQITAQADRLRSVDVSLAAQLDLIAYRLRQTPTLYTDLVTMGGAPLSTPLTGHTNPVGAVAFSPDGHTLATASDDQTVRLWNVTDPAHPTPLGQPLTGHTNFVYAVAFSPNGRTLVSGGRDRTVRLWEMDDDRAIQQICSTTTNALTRTEWEQYVSRELAYRPPCP